MLGLLACAVIGVHFIIMGLFAIIKRTFVQKCLKELYESPYLIMVRGGSSVLAGLFFLFSYPLLWGEERRGVGLIFLGAFTLIEGITHLFFPEWKASSAKKNNTPKATIFMGIALILAGLYFLYEVISIFL